MADQQAERLADAYNLGIKADALREFATQLRDIPGRHPAVSEVADLAVSVAERLDADAETLATTDEPPAPAAELTEAQPDIPPAMAIADSDGDMWLVCRRCHRRLKSIEDEVGLEALVLSTRQHACPAQGGEQAEAGQ